jgi:hypothetical protein
MTTPHYGSFTIADEHTGAEWTLFPSRVTRGRICVKVTAPDKGTLEHCVRALSREYQLTVIGQPIPRQFPRREGWICVMQMQYSDVVDLRSIQP